jgi:CelD/BcsL family acetyltransferase involved in cellulose biosynthesis
MTRSIPPVAAERVTPQTPATQRPTATSFDIAVDTDWAAVAPRWRAQLADCTTTPFQQFAWLDAWYQTIAPAAGATPCLVTVTDRATGGLVMLLPLASTNARAGRMLSFADEELTDFNAPALGPIEVKPGYERKLWRALSAALPSPALPSHAMANFRKMPTVVGGRSNPLVRLAGAHTSSVASNALALDGTHDDYMNRLDRRVRMELERCWRVLNREPNVAFEHVTSLDRALAVIDTMDRHQRDRLQELGSTFKLDEPAQASFYRHDLAARLNAGTVQLTCIRAGTDIVAALLAVADGHTAIVLRISNAGKDWSKVSPGRLIVHKSIEQFYAQGLKVCDLSVGDYDYKRRFGVVRTPLIDLVAALSWRGKPAAAKHWAIGTLRANPALDQRVRQLAQALQRPARPDKGLTAPAASPVKANAV